MILLKNDAACMEEVCDKNKRIILYGAGASCKLILQAYYESRLKDHLEFIVDSNDSLNDTECSVNENIKVRVISLRQFIHIYKGKLDDFIMIMTPYHSLHYVQELDEVEELNGLAVYLFSMIVNKTKPGIFSFRSTEKPLIPKIIHYIWIGGGEMPEEDKKNIETWHQFCPDYEIKLWNEENYDFHKNQYAYEAIEQKQYMYATDYARKDILYTYGGIYFDTDVELLKPIDDLLYNEAFIGIEDGGQLNSGSGLGAVPKHPLIKGMRDIYQDISFYDEDGSINYKYNTYYETRYMLQQGYMLKNCCQNINGMVCFPREVFMPEGIIGLWDNYTERTLANHKIDPYDKTERRKILERVAED